jgi:hypothetical protein
VTVGLTVGVTAGVTAGVTDCWGCLGCPSQGMGSCVVCVAAVIVTRTAFLQTMCMFKQAVYHEAAVSRGFCCWGDAGAVGALRRGHCFC